MRKLLLLAVIIVVTFTTSYSQTLPHLTKKEGITQFYVNNEPYFMFAGELHNSSTGSAHKMRPLWKQMANQNLNTVIAAVSWELVEPQEGVFDFSLVDSMIAGARKENLKLVILWFASWKNGGSTYVPEWVKTDTKRFPLVQNENGRTLNILSTLSKNSRDADAKAFVELMKHIKKVDGEENTVLMVQIENEVGVLGATRDFSETANKAFNSQVPTELITYLEKNKSGLYPVLQKAWADNGYLKKGTWEEVFGKGSKYEGEEWKTNFSYYTEEIFMAWNYASYMGEIAKKGKNEYDLPMYANAWLRQPRQQIPGQYPSGGPLPEVIDIWRAAAPSIDFIAPDIYAVEVFDWVCEEFTRSGNPLFIPETTVGVAGAARALYTFGKYDAIGYAPFGINGGGLVLTAAPGDESMKEVYKCLQNITPYIQKYRGTENISGMFIEEGGRSAKSLDMGDYIISASRFSAEGLFEMTGGRYGVEGEVDKNPVGVIVIKLQENEFLVAGGVGGVAVHVTKSESNKWENVGLASVDEITYENGKVLTHRLNGDETAMGAAVIKPGEVKIFKIRMYGY